MVFLHALESRRAFLMVAVLVAAPVDVSEEHRVKVTAPVSVITSSWTHEMEFAWLHIFLVQVLFFVLFCELIERVCHHLCVSLWLLHLGGSCQEASLPVRVLSCVHHLVLLESFWPLLHSVVWSVVVHVVLHVLHVWFHASMSGCLA